MKLSDADYLRLRRAISLEQLIMRSEPFARPLTAECTLASSINNTTATCKAATTDASGTTPYDANDNAWAAVAAQSPKVGVTAQRDEGKLTGTTIMQRFNPKGRMASLRPRFPEAAATS